MYSPKYDYCNPGLTLIAGKLQASDEDSASRQLRREEHEDFIVLAEKAVVAHQLPKSTKSRRQAVGTQDSKRTSSSVDDRTLQEEVLRSSGTDHLAGKRDSNERLEPLTPKRRRRQVKLEQDRFTGLSRGHEDVFEIPDSPGVSHSVSNTGKAGEMIERREANPIEAVQDEPSASAASRQSNQSEGDESKGVEPNKPKKRRGRPPNVKKVSTNLTRVEKANRELPVASKPPSRNGTEDLDCSQSHSNLHTGHDALGQSAQSAYHEKPRPGRPRKNPRLGSSPGVAKGGKIIQGNQSQRQSDTSTRVSDDRAQEPNREDEDTKSGDNVAQNPDEDEEVNASESEDDYSDTTDEETSSIDRFSSEEGFCTDDEGTLQRSSKDPLMFGRETPWRKIVNAARSVGAKGKGRDRVRYENPIKSDGIKDFLREIKQARRCYRTLASVEGGADGDETKQEDELHKLFKEIEHSIENLRSGVTREDYKLIHDIYAHAIPRMVFLLRSALVARAALYTDPEDEILIQELIQIQQLVLHLCQIARDWPYQPTSSDPPIIRQTSIIILPELRDSILPAFRRELDRRVENRQQARRDARKVEREREKALKEEREEAERDERIRRKWKKSAEDAMRKEAQLPEHLRVLPLSQVPRDIEPRTHEVLLQQQRSPDPAEPRDEQMLELIRLLKELQDLPGTCYTFTLQSAVLTMACSPATLPRYLNQSALAE